MGNQRISDLTPLSSGSLDKNLNVIPVVSGNETYKTTLTDLQSDLSPLSLKASGSVGFSIPTTLPGAWSTGGALNQARYHGIGGAGEKTAALAFGGYTYSTYIPSTCTEAYDGSTWSAVNAMIQGRNNLAGFGTQGAAVAVGGNDQYGSWRGTQYSCTEEYDGSIWSASTPLPVTNAGLKGAGTQNSGVVFGGYVPPSAETSRTDEYNGSTWSAGGALNQSRYNLSGTGTQNAALATGGASQNTDNYYTSCTETYDGIAWTNQAGLSVNRYDHASSGTQNSALVFGGGNYDCDIAYLSNTERWNGSTWSTETPLSNGRYALGGAGNSTGNSIAFGGFNWDQSGPYWGDCTEEFTDGPLTHFTRFDFDNFGCTSQTGSFKGTVDLEGDLDIPGNLSVSSSLISCNSSSFYGATDILADSRIYGSTTLRDTLKLNRYIFSSFSTGGNLIQARWSLAGIGDSQNAALAAGGQTSNSTSSTLSCTEEYDGTSWSSGGSLSANTTGLKGAGTQNAGVVFGGTCYPSAASITRTEEYDGAAWSLGGNLITDRSGHSSAGTQNAALAIAGNDYTQPLPPAGIQYARCTEEYNGTSWSATSGLNTNLGYMSGGVGTGTQNAALQIGGIARIDGTQTQTIFNFVESYDGTSWSACPPIAGSQTTYLSQGGGTVNDSIVSGIQQPTSPFYNQDSAKFNGISWEVGNPLPIRKDSAGNTNTGTNGALFGGKSGNASTSTTYEYTDYGIETEIFGVDNSGNLNIEGDATIGDNIISSDNVCFGSNFTSGNIVFGSFSSGGALITGRNGLAGVGTQDAGLAFGGCTPSACVSCTEEYDGSTWSAGGALITSRFVLAGAGTQNAGLAFGGQTVPGVKYTCTEEYDGSTWSAGGALIFARSFLAGAGTQNAGLAFGGSSPQALSCTEEYDGSTWSVGGALSKNKSAIIGTGNQNAALAVGGNASSTEAYDGISWVQLQDLPINKTLGAGAGTQNSSLAIGGSSSTCSADSGINQFYNGTTWNTANSLLTPRRCLAGAGSSQSPLAIGGACLTSNISYLSCTEEANNFVSISPLLKSDSSDCNSITGGTKLNITNPTNAWSTGGNLIQARSYLAGIGSKHASLAVGGQFPTTKLSCTEEYNNSIWSVGGALINPTSFLAGAGTQNAGLVFGGSVGNSNAAFSCTEEYDGSSWTAGGALINPTRLHSGIGYQDAALAVGGAAPSALSCTEEYDGSTWSAGGALITARFSLAGAGTQNAGLVFGGQSGPTRFSCTEEYDGSAWSAGGALNIVLSDLGGAGTQNAGLAFGGGCSPSAGSKLACTEEYNGTSWTLASPLNIARCAHGGSGTQDAALAIGGFTGATSLANTEEYNTSSTTEATFEHTNTGRLVFAQISSSLDFANDAAAAAGGVPLGGIYRNGGDIKIRLV